MNKIIVIIGALCISVSCAMPKSEQAARHNDYDPDLRGWKTASWSPFTTADSISGFAWGNGCYVAVATSGLVGWSEDGDIWHRAIAAEGEETNPFDASFNAVTWGGGVFVAAGDAGRVAYSADGKSWTAVGYSEGINGFGSENIMGIAWGNDLFVAVGGNSNISYSPNGITWAGRRDTSLNGFDGVKINSIAYDANQRRFYIVSDGGGRGYTDNPTEGNWHCQWPESDDPFDSDGNITAVTIGRYGNLTGIAVVFANIWYDDGGNRRIDESRRIAIATNPDFTVLDADVETFLLENNRINSIAWGGADTGYFVVGGDNAMIGHWYSAEPSRNDTRVWTAYSFSEFKKKEISALAACNGRFFIGNLGGKIGYSK